MILEMFQEACFLDTETTGFGDCRLIELSLGTLDGKITTVRAAPTIPIEEAARAVHGISEEDLKGLPAFTDNIRYKQLKERIEQSVVIAHNAPFDIAVLAREGIVVRNYIDTLAVAKRLYRHLPQHNLQFLREHFHLEIEARAHSSAGDVAVLIALYARMRRDQKI